MVFKTPENIWKNIFDKYVYIISSWYLKNGWVLSFWMPRKEDTFTLFTRISAFYLFSNFVRFGPFKNCSRAIFSGFWLKFHLNTCITPPKLKIFNLTFLVEWLGGHLEVSQTRSMSFHRLYFNLVWLLNRAKRAMTDIKKDLWPDLWRHKKWVLGSDKISQHIRKVQVRSFQMSFSDWELVH